MAFAYVRAFCSELGDGKAREFVTSRKKPLSTKSLTPNNPTVVTSTIHSLAR